MGGTRSTQALGWLEESSAAQWACVTKLPTLWMYALQCRSSGGQLCKKQLGWPPAALRNLSALTLALVRSDWRQLLRCLVDAGLGGVRV